MLYKKKTGDIGYFTPPYLPTFEHSVGKMRDFRKVSHVPLKRYLPA